MLNFFFGGSLGGKSGGVVACGGTALAPLLRHSHTAPPRSIPARRRRVLSNYSALSLYNGNKGKTKPHDASNTREQFESSLRTGFRRQFVSQSATSNCFWQIGHWQQRGIKDDCANLQLKGGKIWTDRGWVD